MSAILWLASQGLPVFLPVGHSPHYDLITDLGDGLVRVQVKTSTQNLKDRWDVSVCNRGGNRSWNGLVKRLDASHYDRLFVLVGDGRRWFIPAAEVGGGSHIRLGGPKYAEFEIERGQPLQKARPSLDSATPWRDSRAVKGDGL